MTAGAPRPSARAAAGCRLGIPWRRQAQMPGRILGHYTMNFCNQCGARVELRIPPGDHLPRFVCEQCGTIHYENPRIVVGCVPEHQGRILICKRAIEPRRGFWTIPAGFLENNETLQQGAARESQEEALAIVKIGSLLAIANVLHAHQVHVFFRATLEKPEFGAGPESLEVKLVPPEEIPWGEIAFPSTDFALRRYLEDRAAGREPHHFTTFDRRLPGR
jgi:ADP-ribose pyrophosphatase YjhB (NUDIX family)